MDLEPQPRYPFEFHQMDALYVLDHGTEPHSAVNPLDFDLIHASPPCQAYSRLRHLPWVKARTAEYWDSLPPTLAALSRQPVPWIVENVASAPLDGIQLCGGMFGLQFEDGTPLYRHRRFASSFFLLAPGHAKHVTAMRPGPLLGDRARRGYGKRDKLDYIIAGKGRTAGTGQFWSSAMGIDWMTIKELAQAIPPAYTEWLGREWLSREATA